jgi:hypothetical protein
MWDRQVVRALRERRSRAEAELAAYGAKVSLVRVELEALNATIELFAADAAADPSGCADALAASREAGLTVRGAVVAELPAPA